MAERKQIKYEGIKPIASQLSIQPSGIVGTPSTPPQYNVASGNLRDANRKSQFAKALGTLNPALKNLAFSLAEGARDDRIAEAKQQKLQKDNEELLGLELHAQFNTWYQPTKEYPNGKLITKNGLEVDLGDWWDDETGEVRIGKAGSAQETLKKLGLRGFKDLTEYNLENVRYWYQVGRARTLAKEFNDTVINDENMVSTLRAEWEQWKETPVEVLEDGKKVEKLLNKDKTFSEFTADRIQLLRQAFYSQIPNQSAWAEADITPGLNKIKKAYAESEVNSTYAILNRAGQGRITTFFDTLPTQGIDGKPFELDLGKYLHFRDHVYRKGLMIGDKNKADLNIITHLRGRVANAKNLRELYRYSPEFLFSNLAPVYVEDPETKQLVKVIDPNTNKQKKVSRSPLATNENIASEARVLRSEWESKYNQFQQELEDKKQEQKDNNVEVANENLVPHHNQLLGDIHNNPSDPNLHRATLKKLENDYRDAFPDTWQTVMQGVHDRIDDAFRNDRAFGVSQKERDLKVDPTKDNNHNELFTKEIQEVRREGWWDISRKKDSAGDKTISNNTNTRLLDIQKRISEARGKNEITSETQSFLLGRIDKIRKDREKDIKEWKVDVIKTDNEDKEKKKLSKINTLYSTFNSNRSDYEGNEKLLNDPKNAHLFTGPERLAINKYITALYKAETDKKPVVTDPIIAQTLQKSIFDTEITSDKLAIPLRSSVDDAYIKEKIAKEDWKYLTGLITSRTTDIDKDYLKYTTFPGYSSNLKLINNLLDSTATMMVKGIGWEEGIVKAHSGAVFTYEKAMSVWASDNKEDALNPDKVFEKAQEISEGILNSSELQSVFSTSRSKMDISESVDIKNNILNDLKYYVPNLRVIGIDKPIKINKEGEEESTETDRELSPKLYSTLMGGMRGVGGKKEIFIKEVDFDNVINTLNSFDMGSLRDFWFPTDSEEGRARRRKADQTLRDMKNNRQGPFTNLPFKGSDPAYEREAVSMLRLLFNLRKEYLKRMGN